MSFFRSFFFPSNYKIIEKIVFIGITDTRFNSLDKRNEYARFHLGSILFGTQCVSWKINQGLKKYSFQFQAAVFV